MLETWTKSWTYGAEHEWGDHDIRKTLPLGFARDTHDITIVNSNGIANDPKGKLYNFGGEINTPPSNTMEEQVDYLTILKSILPEATVNYRSNLHIHIRVPGLGDDLNLLKQVQSYIHNHMRLALSVIEPIPKPMEHQYEDASEYAGAQRRWRRRKVSHQTLLTPERLSRQLEATSVEEFYQLEVPWSKKGVPQWHFQPRLCVNLRQHRETDTVEFRHFPGTLNEDQMANALRWCHDFMIGALVEMPIEDVLDRGGFRVMDMPKFEPYNHAMECNYRATVHDGTIKKPQIAENIQRILQGEQL